MKCPPNENVLAAAILQEKWQVKVRELFLEAREKSSVSGRPRADLVKRAAAEILEVRTLLDPASLKRYRFKSAGTAGRMLRELCERAAAEATGGYQPPSNQNGHRSPANENGDGFKNGLEDDERNFLQVFLAQVSKTN